MRPGNGEGPTAATVGLQDTNQTDDATIVPQHGDERKAFLTAAATAAQAGCGLYELAAGGFLLTKYGLSRELPDLGAVGALLRQMGGRP